MKSTVLFIAGLLLLSVLLVGCTQQYQAPAGGTDSGTPSGTGGTVTEPAAPTISDSELSEFESVLEDSEGDMQTLEQSNGAPEEFPE